MLRPMMPICTTVSSIEPILTSLPWLSVYETFVGPASAWVPKTRISVIPRATITIAIGEVPRR